MPRIVVFNQNYIGDVVFTLPALRSLREGYPESYIKVVAGGNALEVLKGNPYISSLARRPKTYGEKFEFIRRMRRENYDICISFSSRSLELAIFSLLSGCKRRLGFYNASTLPFLNFYIKENNSDHSALDYLKLAIAAGGKKVSLIPQVFLSEGELQRGEEILEALGVGKDEMVFGILLGGSTSFKRWYPPALLELLNNLAPKGQVLLFGGREFKEFGNFLAEGKANIHNLAGYVSLREAMALLKYCDIFIGQDSGLTHISAALGVPTLGLYGATDPKRTAPIGEKVNIIYKPLPCGPCWGKKRCERPLCIEAIGAKEIMERVDKLLGKR